MLKLSKLFFSLCGKRVFSNMRWNMVLLCRLPALAEATYRDHYPSSCVVVVVGVGVTKKFCHIFIENHRSQLPDIWHRTSVWRTLSYNAVLNLPHVLFLFDATFNIVDIGKFAHKIISVTFFSGITEASFLIFGTEHQYGDLYRVRHFWICGMFTSCLTRLCPSLKYEKSLMITQLSMF